MACSPFFSSPGAVLMSPHDGGVDHHVLIVVVGGQHIEDTSKYTARRPPAETLVDNLPIAEPTRKIAPRNTGPVAVKHSLHKQPVVLSRTANVALTARQRVLDPFPLVVSQAVATHKPALLKADLS